MTRFRKWLHWFTGFDEPEQTDLSSDQRLVTIITMGHDQARVGPLADFQHRIQRVE